MKQMSVGQQQINKYHKTSKHIMIWLNSIKIITNSEQKIYTASNALKSSKVLYNTNIEFCHTQPFSFPPCNSSRMFYHPLVSRTECKTNPSIHLECFTACW